MLNKRIVFRWRNVLYPRSMKSPHDHAVAISGFVNPPAHLPHSTRGVGIPHGFAVFINPGQVDTRNTFNIFQLIDNPSVNNVRVSIFTGYI